MPIHRTARAVLADETDRAQSGKYLDQSVTMAIGAALPAHGAILSREEAADIIERTLRRLGFQARVQA